MSVAFRYHRSEREFLLIDIGIPVFSFHTINSDYLSLEAKQIFFFLIVYNDSRWLVSGFDILIVSFFYIIAIAELIDFIF